jgi:hypothetical protein
MFTAKFATQVNINNYNIRLSGDKTLLLERSETKVKTESFWSNPENKQGITTILLIYYNNNWFESVNKISNDLGINRWDSVWVISTVLYLFYCYSELRVQYMAIRPEQATTNANRKQLQRKSEIVRITHLTL